MRNRVIGLALTLALAAPILAAPYDIAVEGPASGDPLVLQGDYRPARKPDAPVLVLLHGLGSTRDEWAPLVAAAEKLGWGTLAYDLRGHGRSRLSMKGAAVDYEDKRYVRSPAFWSRMAEDLKAQLTSLEKNASVPPGRIVLVGASLGANVVFQVAAERTDLRGVVLLSPGLNYAGYETESLPPRVKIPVLLVAAQPDLYAYESTRRLRALFPKGAPVDFFDLKDGTPRGAHGAQLFDGVLETRILNWIRRRG